MTTQLITEWITDANTSFLIGAGCSKCADKPLMPELTDKVKDGLSQDGLRLLEDLKGSHGRAATVEDLINHLIQYEKLIGSRKDGNTSDHWTVETIGAEIRCVQESIVRHVGVTWQASSVHEQFLQRLIKQKNAPTWDIFTLNYDTVIEASLEKLKFAYTDGFRGSENAFFDSTLYDERPANTPFFRLYKLHGSVNWMRDCDGTVRRRPSSTNGNGGAPSLVFPAEQKYVQTQYGVYEKLLASFRQRLRESRKNNKLVILGYSFSDEHINVAIEDSILALGSNLTVYAFVGAETELDSQVQRLEKLVGRCDHRMNIMVGNKKCIGDAFGSENWDKALERNLWRFENLVDMVVKGK